MTFINQCGPSIVMAPICTRCRGIIETNVYLENLIDNKDGAILGAQEFLIHPAKCPHCGAHFQHLVYPGKQTNPYNVKDVMKEFGKEFSGNA